MLNSIQSNTKLNQSLVRFGYAVAFLPVAIALAAAVGLVVSTSVFLMVAPFVNVLLEAALLVLGKGLGALLFIVFAPAVGFLGIMLTARLAKAAARARAFFPI